MLYKKRKENALKIHKRASDERNLSAERVEMARRELDHSRTESKECIAKIERLINSIANTSKSFEVDLSQVKVNIRKFKETEKYAEESLKDSQKTGAIAGTGIVTGVVVANFAPIAMKRVATTFETSSIEKPISSLSETVAKKSALACLRSRALLAKGTGASRGGALLASAGRIGWGISGVSVAISVVIGGFQNKKCADKLMEEAKTITMDASRLDETTAIIDNMRDETDRLLEKLSHQYERYSWVMGSDYMSIPEKEKMGIGAMINNTLALSELLNQKVGGNNDV